MRSLILAACMALAGAPAWAASPADFSLVDSNLKACLGRNGSTPDVDNCNAIATAAADRRLNEIYGKLINGLKHPLGPDDARDGPEILKRLVAAERAWIAFRDAECSYQSTYMLGGTGETNAYGACLYSQTKIRVEALSSPNAPQNLR